MEPCTFKPKLEKQKKSTLRKFLIFRERETPKKFLVFQETELVTVFSLYFVELDVWLYALTNIFIQVTFW